MKFKIRSKINKKKFIYGNFRHNKKSDTLIIIMSGYCGGENFRLNVKTSQYFYKQNYSVLRFNFCNEKNNQHRTDALRLDEITFDTYKNEMKNIIDYFGTSFSQVILIGHSFGAITAVLFLEKYRQYKKKVKLILWDQSLLPWSRKDMAHDFIYNKKEKTYTEKDTHIRLHKKFYENLIKTNILKKFSRIQIPTCIIAAKGSGDIDAQKYFAHIKNKKESKIHIIKNTGHLFEEKKAQAELFSITHQFILHQQSEDALRFAHSKKILPRAQASSPLRVHL